MDDAIVDQPACTILNPDAWVSTADSRALQPSAELIGLLGLLEIINASF